MGCDFRGHTWDCSSYHCIYHRPTIHVRFIEYEGPDFWVASIQQITRLSLEHSIFIGDVDQLQVVLAFGIGNESKLFTVIEGYSWRGRGMSYAGVSLLAIFAHHQCVILVVFLQKLFGVVVRVLTVGLASTLKSVGTVPTYLCISWQVHYRQPAVGSQQPMWPRGMGATASIDCESQPQTPVHRWERKLG